jgi:hypothetical protein
MYYCSEGVFSYDTQICEACGDINQRCCRNTAYPCDYGTCVNGYCRYTGPGGSSTSSSGGSSSSTSTSSGQGGSSSSSGGDRCGHLGEPCCFDINSLGPLGPLMGKPPCETGLDCIGDICVEGPDIVAYVR